MIHLVGSTCDAHIEFCCECDPKLEVSTDAIEVGGTSDYNKLTNKPTIEGVELKRGMSLSDFGLNEITPEVVKEYWFGGGE